MNVSRAFVASMRVSAVDECHGLVYWINECFTCVRSQYVGQRCGRVSRPGVLD